MKLRIAVGKSPEDILYTFVEAFYSTVGVPNDIIRNFKKVNNDLDNGYYAKSVMYDLEDIVGDLKEKGFGELAKLGQELVDTW